MAIFVTGSTGYLGSYIVAGLLRNHRESLQLLVRANSEQEARERLWQSLQLHFDFSEFFDRVNSRVRIFRGDLTSLRGFAESQIRKAVPQRESARFAGSDSTRPPRAGPKWVATLFSRVYGCSCRSSQE
jgi:nucleoside-diphosphate-sugar epimerase